MLSTTSLAAPTESHTLTLILTSVPERSGQIVWPPVPHEDPHCLILGLVLLRGTRQGWAAASLSLGGMAGPAPPGIGGRRPGRLTRPLELATCTQPPSLGVISQKRGPRHYCQTEPQA